MERRTRNLFAKLSALALAMAVGAGAASLAIAAPDVIEAQAPPAKGPAGKPPPRPPGRPPLEPASIAALKRMGAQLLTLGSFEINATISIEYVLDNNQKILVGGSSRYRVRRPDRLRIDLATDVLERVFQYDGKDLVVTAPREK